MKKVNFHYATHYPFSLPIPQISCHNSPMRRILTSVVLLVLLFPSIAIGETMDDLVLTNGLYYKKFTDVPFTGKTTGKIQGTFRNGKMDGPYVRYYENGRIGLKVTFKNGKEDGPWVSYHENGRLGSKGIHKNGKRDGPWVSYN